MLCLVAHVLSGDEAPVLVQAAGSAEGVQRCCRIRPAWSVVLAPTPSPMVMHCWGFGLPGAHGPLLSTYMPFALECVCVFACVLARLVCG
jgi:hypothetical protein